MKKIYTLLLGLLLGLTNLMAQELTVSGKVTDGNDGSALPGVSIAVKGTTNGTITDFDGKYVLKVEKGQTLVFSFMGYVQQELVAENSTLDLALAPDTKALEEVVVIGYGVQKKSDLTGSIASVKGDVMEALPIANTESLLQGRAAGVQITSFSGSPGSGASVRIRGTGTVNNSEPLYVVDGIFMNDVSSINPMDIDRVEVLKDASATAIYGSRGANGVVLITTKGGQKGVKVNLSANYGWQQLWKKPDLLNSEEWFDVVNIARANGGKAPLSLIAPANDLNRTTDWFDEVTQVAPIANISTSVSGGNDKTTYLVSAAYFDQQGVVKTSQYDRINFRTNVTSAINDVLKVGTKLNIANSTRVVVPDDYYNGILNVAMKLDPVTPVRDAAGKFASSPYTDVINPLAYLDRETQNRNYFDMQGNAFVELTPIKGLTLKSSFSLAMGRYFTHTYQPVYYMAPDERRDKSVVQKDFSFYNNWLSENTVNYQLSLGKHDLTVLAGVTAESTYSEWLSAVRAGTPGNDEELQYLSAATEGDQAFNSGEELRMSSYLGRINYSFDGRYSLTASVRRDGSSVFGPGKRYGIFPSAAVAWNLNKESFMGFLPDAVSGLKLRAGWGEVGNANIAPYGFASTISTNATWSYSNKYVFNDKVVPGAAPIGLANQSIKWEAVTSTNVGLDLSLLNDQITFVFDYFIKDTEDMLVRVPVPTFAGYISSPYSNAGTVRNTGFEFTLGYNGAVGDFKYSVDLNASHIVNEVTSLGAGQPITGGTFRAFSTSRTEVGQPIGYFYGYIVDGVYQDAQQVADSHQPTAKPGDFIFRDVNGDGKLTNLDRTYIGTPHPELYYGINLNLSYRGFGLTAFFQGVQGNDLFNAQKWYTMSDNTTTAKSREILGYWYPGSGINDMFGLNASSTNNNLRESTFFIEDGSYLRLKALELSYSFNKFPTTLGWMKNLKVYASGTNLLTFTKYSGLDPEVGSTSSSNTLSAGLDYGTYPQARVYTLGASLNF